MVSARVSYVPRTLSQKMSRSRVRSPNRGIAFVSIREGSSSKPRGGGGGVAGARDGVIDY